MDFMAKNEEITAFETYGWNIPDSLIRQAVRKGEGHISRTRRRLRELFTGGIPLKERYGFWGDVARALSDDCSYIPAQKVGRIIQEGYLQPERYVPTDMADYITGQHEAITALRKGESLYRQSQRRA